jgi:hypothetical protein
VSKQICKCYDMITLYFWESDFRMWQSSNSIIIFNFVQFLISNCRFYIVSLLTMVLKSRNKIFKLYLGNISNTRSSSSQKLSFTLLIISSVEAWKFRTLRSYQRDLCIMHDILSLATSTVHSISKTQMYQSVVGSVGPLGKSVHIYRILRLQSKVAERSNCELG